MTPRSEQLLRALVPPGVWLVRKRFRLSAKAYFAVLTLLYRVAISSSDQ